MLFGSKPKTLFFLFSVVIVSGCVHTQDQVSTPVGELRVFPAELPPGWRESLTAGGQEKFVKDGSTVRYLTRPTAGENPWKTLQQLHNSTLAAYHYYGEVTLLSKRKTRVCGYSADEEVYTIQNTAENFKTTRVMITTWYCQKQGFVVAFTGIYEPSLEEEVRRIQSITECQLAQS